MLLVNQNNVVDAKSVNASLIALKNQADKLNRQIATLEKSIKSLDGSKADEKDLSNYYTKDETYNKTEVYNKSEITNNYYNKQSVDSALTNFLTNATYKNLSYTFTEVQGGNTITIATTPQVKNLLIVYTSIGTAYFTRQAGAEWQYLQVFTNALTQYGWEIRFRYLWETGELSTGLVSKGASADFPTIYGYRYN